MPVLKHVSVVAAFVGIIGVAGTASARRIYTAVGAGCVPVDEDVQVDNFDSRGFGVGFKGFATGDVRLVCPISVSANTVTFRRFVMSYKDTDGMSTQARIRATLRRVADGSNASFPICTADSDTSSVTGNTTLSCDFTDFVPLENTSYFFEVLIERSSTAQDPEFLALGLFDTN